MRRGGFERQCDEAVGPVLRSHGFLLTPQPPPDTEVGATALAVFEARPAEFAARFPSLVVGADSDAPCVDLWIGRDEATGKVRIELEGSSMPQLQEVAGLPKGLRLPIVWLTRRSS